MGKNDTKAEAPKVERVRRSDEEILADLERQLAEKRAKAEAKKHKARDAAWAKRAKLVEKRDAIAAQIEAIDAEFPQPEATEA